MAREELFSFIPETQLTSNYSDPEFRVSVNTMRMLYFPREIVDIYDLDKKYFKFYADPQKKAIAWSYFEKGSIEDLTGLRQLTINKTNGAGMVSVAKILSALGIKELKGVLSEIPVKKYKGEGYLAQEVNYIIINEKDAKERRNKRKDLRSGFPGDEPSHLEEGVQPEDPKTIVSDSHGGGLLGS